MNPFISNTDKWPRAPLPHLLFFLQLCQIVALTWISFSLLIYMNTRMYQIVLQNIQPNIETWIKKNLAWSKKILMGFFLFLFNKFYDFFFIVTVNRLGVLMQDPLTSDFTERIFFVLWFMVYVLLINVSSIRKQTD